jgi:sucrose-6-phosphate hydrolase SacC (GH32 family)
VDWNHHPLAIPTGPPGACDEHTICTGAPFFHDGVYYFWYATRMVPEGGSYADHTQHVCLATSSDGIHFEKDPGNPILDAAPSLRARHFRDPVVFRHAETGRFHMLVTSQLAEEPLFLRNGALAHLTSTDLRNWEWQDPFLIPGLNETPECPDYFEWGGRHYLTFLDRGQMRYRMAKHPLGPWERPRVDTLDGPLLKAMKTAPFADDRRIGVGFLSSRQGEEDAGKCCYAGNAVFREIVQHGDGTLGAHWPEEMVPRRGPSVAARARPVVGRSTPCDTTVTLDCPEAFAACAIDDVPADARVRMTVDIDGTTPHAGLFLRAEGTGTPANELRFSPFERRICLRNAATPLTAEHMLLDVDGLDRPFDVDIVQTGSVVDLQINRGRTCVTRLYKSRGDRLYLWVENGHATFRGIEISALA